MKDITITIPDNCELIQDGNTYIVKEKKQVPPRSWREFCKNYPRTTKEYFIGYNSSIDKILGTSIPRDAEHDKNICSSKEEAEAFLALIQLRQLRKAWVGIWEQPKPSTTIGVVTYDINSNKLVAEAGNYWILMPLSFQLKKWLKTFLIASETYVK